MGASGIIAAFAILAATTATPAARSETNACALLTRDEAAAVVGASVAEGKPLKGDMGQSIEVANCTFQAAGAKELRVNVWHFSQQSSSGLAMYRSLCSKKEQATGLGDVACWYSAEHKELQVLTGSTILILELVGRRGATAEMLAAAKQALGRLK